MTDFGRRLGEGDMLKAIYDPNEDGVIALGQTEADIKAAGVAVLIGIHAALANVHHTLPNVAGLIATHAGISAAHHAQGQTQAQVNALIATHADLPNVHHTPPTADPGEGYIYFDPGSYHEIVQGSYTMIAPHDDWHVGPIFNDSNTDGDALNWKAYLAAGTYTLVFYGRTGPLHGILDTYIDTTEVASIDFYSAGNVDMAPKRQTGIVIATSGLKTVKIIIDGKNVSATGYRLIIETIVLYRTA